MENTVCNSFYAKTEPTPSTTGSVQTNTTDTELETAKKKKLPILLIWAASYFLALVISPEDNINNIDKTETV